MCLFYVWKTRRSILCEAFMLVYERGLLYYWAAWPATVYLGKLRGISTTHLSISALMIKISPNVTEESEMVAPWWTCGDRNTRCYDEHSSIWGSQCWTSVYCTSCWGTNTVNCAPVVYFSWLLLCLYCSVSTPLWFIIMLRAVVTFETNRCVSAATLKMHQQVQRVHTVMLTATFGSIHYI